MMNRLTVLIKPAPAGSTKWYYNGYGHGDFSGKYLEVLEYSYDRYAYEGKYIFKSDCTIINQVKNARDNQLPNQGEL